MSSNPYGESGPGLPVALCPAEFDAGRRLVRQQRGRIAARRPPSNHQDLDLDKPWMNGRLAREVRLMYDLKVAAGQTKRNQDFSAFQDQRRKVKRDTKFLRDSYFVRNPGQEEFWLPVLAAESSRFPHTCDNCETNFDSEQQLLRHEREQHEVCNLDGCTYTASAAKLEIHILHMHSSGLYDRVRQGAADVTKWRAERKRNYPSAAKTHLKDVKAADRKRKYVEGLKARREEIETKRKTKLEELKTKKRGSRRRRRPRGSGDDRQAVATVATSVDGGDALPFWFGTMEKFRGTKFYSRSTPDVQQLHPHVGVKEPDFHISDDEWQQQQQDGRLSKDDDPEPVDDDDDDEPPEECAASKNELHATSQTPEPKPRVPPPSEPRASAAAPVATAKTTGKSSFSREEIERRLMQRPKRPPTLLERLLDKEIDRERDQLVQCLRYVCSRNFFLHE